MFCPKCGTKNPEDGKYCRKCGTDLSGVSSALAGKHDYVSEKSHRKKKKHTWESAMGKLFTGLAFLGIAIILGVTGVAGGQFWWFWMLIPAFSILGTGVAEVIQLNQSKSEAAISSGDERSIEGSAQEQGSLPAAGAEFAVGQKPEMYETGDLVPPSVTEGTTRLLEKDQENETMTLPKPD
ncbi:MAG: zinc-ribbon domain-containing protein [Pyrinomonadaceae bacterium]|nr:zinc-ribbon domain-containing protein [Pyrinomonadaceae bacterium]